jgi:transcription elongation GreA/GreB family factor
MTNPEKIAFKHSLKNLGLDILRQRMATAQEAMDQAQEAANSEEKSSAGDKYETGRAMGQLQKEMHGRQLAEYAKEVKALQSIVVDSLCDRGSPGAFVRAKEVAFFVSAGLGRQEVEGITILFVSPMAPLARALQNKGAGDTILFNGAGIVIEDLY